MSRDGDRRAARESRRWALARPAVVALLATLAVAATAGLASAHELTAREFTAPVPLPMVFAGAGATVGLTALWLGVADRESTRSVDTAQDSPARTVASLQSHVVRPLSLALRVGFLALFAGALAHGLLGRQVATANLATLVVWPLVLKGVGLLAIAVGSPWRVLSPWETCYDALVALEGRELAIAGEYPDRLAAWPAVVGFVLGVGILENLTVATRSPATTVAVAAGYAAVMLLGAVMYGRTWFERADALTVLFDLLGRVAPLAVERTDAGGLAVGYRPPWVAVSRTLRDPSLVAFVVAAVYTVSFDGFTATRTYRTLLASARDVLGVGLASVTLYVVGLAAALVTFAAAAVLAEYLGRPTRVESAERTHSRRQAAAAAFGGTVVPIAAAYEVAHNYPFVAANIGQTAGVLRALALGGDPHPVRPLAGLTVGAFWWSQVLLVVVGHLIAVVAAHRVATARYGPGTPSRRGHAPFVLVMVGYTVLSLWIVSQPIVG